MIDALLATAGFAAVVFVLFPILFRPSERASRASSADLERQDLAEKKERILASIHDLDFEHQAGKLSEKDYEQVRADFLLQAAQVMEQMESLPKEKRAEPPAAPPEPKVEPKAEEAYAPELRPFCVKCGQQNPSGALFCFRCGQRIEILHA